MVKPRAKSSTQVVALRTKAKRLKVVGRKRGQTTTAGDAYRKLLVDPCNSPLITSPYEGSLGGPGVRSTILVNNVVACGVYAWHPVFGLWFAEAADTTSLVSFARVTNSSTDGRGIAGCFSTSYLGSESARSGLVYCGVVPGAVVWQYAAASIGGGNVAFTIGGAAAKLSMMERMPVDRCEINWFPSEGDATVHPPLNFNAANSNAVETVFSSCNFTMAVLTYMPLNSVQFKMTGVVEKLALTDSIPWAVAAPTKPPFDWKSELTALTGRDPTWFINTFKKVSSLVGTTLTGFQTAGLPGALGYLTAGIAGMAMSGKQRVRTV